MQLLAHEPALHCPVSAAFPLGVQALECLEKHACVEESIYSLLAVIRNNQSGEGGGGGEVVGQ